MTEAVEHAASESTQTGATLKGQIELGNIKLERSKLALDVRIKRRELDAHHSKTWRQALANPLMLAIVGGSLTLLTSIVTNYLTASATRDADERKGMQAREAEARALQSDLIKTFLKTPDSKTARDNLTFLIESGLIPDHEKRIKEYLASNSKTIPKLGDGSAPAAPYPPCPVIDLGKEASAGDRESLGVSLHFATNRVDPNSYGGWDAQLPNTVSDANAMQRLAAKLGYHTNILSDATSRSDCLASALTVLSAQLKAGDSLLLTLSGHGGQIPDISGNEPDNRLETWALYDKQVDANELYARLAHFSSGVTVIVVEDASHAAVLRPPKGASAASPQVFVLAGTQEDQVAMDAENRGNGAFTAALLSAWNDGKFKGSYHDLINAIQAKLPSTQKPQLYAYGPRSTDKSLQPFRIVSPTRKE